MTRKETRREFADLLTAELGALVSRKPGTEEPAVYRGQVADFSKARAAVVVSSGGTVAQILAPKNYVGVYRVVVDVFVLYADPEIGWDEEDAEDLLDEISEQVLRTLEKHPTGNNWSALDWTEPSEPNSVEIGGIEYRHEQIILKPS